jgi:TrmH family RNA methyltransferase
MAGPALSAPISSRRHDLVLRCRRLAAGRTPEDAALLLDGPHLVDVALAAGWPLEIVAVAHGAGDRSAEIAALLARAAAARVRCVPVTAGVMDAMSPVPSPAGLIAIAAPPPQNLPTLANPSPPLVLATIDVQDPGNLGALVRSADAFGATGVACLGASADPFGWKALRGSMGSALRVPIWREPDVTAAVRRLRHLGLAIVVAAARGAVVAANHPWEAPTALLVGSEGRGVPADVVAEADARVWVPMRDGVDSLNVAVAAGVLLSAARQRREACTP